MVALSHPIAMPSINLDPIFSISTRKRTGRKIGGEKRSFLMTEVNLTVNQPQNLKISKKLLYPRLWEIIVCCLPEKAIPGMG